VLTICLQIFTTGSSLSNTTVELLFKIIFPSAYVAEHFEETDSHTWGRMYFWKQVNRLFPDYTFQLSYTN